MEKRNYPRLYFHYLVNYRVIDTYQPKQGVSITENLSLGGVMIEFEQNLQVGSILEIDIASKDSIITAKTRVCHNAKTSRNTYDIGLEFIEISLENLNHLKNILKY